MLDACVAQRDLEADVAHHRGDDRVRPSAAPRASSASRTSASRRRRRRRVRVRRRRSRDRRRRRYAMPSGYPPSSTAARELLRRRRAAAQIDVAAVGLAADAARVEAKLLEQPRRDRRRGAVGAVDDEAHAPQRVRVRQDRAEMREIFSPVVDLFDRRAHRLTAAATTRPR